MLTYADLLYANHKEERLPIGTRVTIGGSKHKVDKMYRGMTGTVIEYGHPASIYDHLVQLDQLEGTRWFRPSEFAKTETPDVHSID